MARVYLALGTNMGEREYNLVQAIQELTPYVHLTQSSAVYETEPWGMTEQPPFLNMVVEGETILGPSDLLSHLKAIEKSMGRVQVGRYGPRIIDLDILFYDDLVLEDLQPDSAELEIPHPRLAERRFVLVPLVQIAPNLIHPSLGVTTTQLLSHLPDDESVRLYKKP